MVNTQFTFNILVSVFFVVVNWSKFIHYILPFNIDSSINKSSFSFTASAACVLKEDNSDIRYILWSFINITFGQNYKKNENINNLIKKKPTVK